MASVIQNLLNNTLGDGARSTKFDCLLNFGTSEISEKKDDEISYLVKTSQFPGKTHEPIDIKFKGRTIPIKGQVKYNNTWSCSFYLTEDHSLKQDFEWWIESLDQQHNMLDSEAQPAPVQKAQKSNYSNYTTDLSIIQLDFTGDNKAQKMKYTLHNCFPKSVSTIDVDYSTVGAILDFTVEFSYAYYTTENTVGADGTIVDQAAKGVMDSVNSAIGDVKKSIGGAIKGIF